MPPNADANASRPRSRPHSSTPSSKERLSESSNASYGQIIEYIQDRLYLASYTHEPDANTPFPYPSTKKPNKILSGNAFAQEQRKPLYFSVEDYLLYNSFFADFGPLHIGHVYRFSVLLHQALSAPENENRALVFWGYADSRSRANAACLLACYMILIQSWPPHLALAPLAQMDPPPMPFRDAGYSQADFTLTIQDVVYGVWRAKEQQLCGLETFDLEEYERHERVENGDFNWISPNFVAFASPQHQPINVIPSTSPEYAKLPKCTSEIYHSDLPSPFKQVLGHFRAKKVGLVVRLNSELYSPSYFTALGIRHLDMIFEDGTCPPLALVRKFIRLSHDMITNRKKQVAVHCKAGLGRTGCLIGAYLIYRHGFTANEVIAYMRFMRPGMVVGPQQHWLHLNQNSFRQWWFEDSLRDKQALTSKSTPITTPQRNSISGNGQTYTPPNGSQKRQALGELDYNEKGHSPGVHDENLPAPTPGQPRKASKIYAEYMNSHRDSENEPSFDSTTEVVTIERHVKGEGESEEEFQLRVLSRRPTSLSNQKRRAQSCVTTMTSAGSPERNEAFVQENKSPIARTPSEQRNAGGSGALSISKRANPIRRNTDRSGGIRKTSGRVGSAGALANATRIKQ